MSRLSDNLYTFIKGKNGRVALGDICAAAEFAGEDRKDISAALRTMGTKKVVFRSVSNGKAYYSTKPEEGEAMNPTKAWIGDTASAFGGVVNRDGSSSDILFGGAKNPTSELFSALDKLTDLTKQLIGEENLTKGNQSTYVSQLTYDQKREFKGDGYSIEIPDGFVLIEGKEALDEFGENRDFMAYLPNHLVEDEKESAAIKVYPGNELPFVTINDKNVNVYYPLVEDYLFLYEQAASGEQLAAMKMYGDAYAIKTSNSIAWCSYMDSTTSDHTGGYHFFYVNIPIRNKARMFRVDINDMFVENVIEARKLVVQIFEKVHSEHMLQERKRLDSGYFTDEILTKEKVEEWKEELHKLVVNHQLFQTVGIEGIKKQISVDAAFGNMNTDQASINREIKRYGKEYLTDQASLISEIMKEIASFFLKASETNKDHDEIYELQDYVMEQYGDLKTVGLNLQDGEEAISLPIGGFDEFMAAVNNPILMERKEKQAELKLQKEKEEKYQKALRLCESRDYREKKEGIDLLEELGDFEDAAATLAVQKELLASMDVLDKYAYLANEIKEKLEAEDRNETTKYPERNAAVDNETDRWVREQEARDKEINDSYDAQTGMIGRLMQMGSYSSIYDSALQPYIERMKEVMRDTKNERESLMNDIYRRFNRIKDNSYSAYSLKKLVNLYKKVYDDGNGYSFNINQYNLAKMDLSWNCKYHLTEMEDALSSKPKDPSAQRDADENEKWKKVDKLSSVKNDEIKKLKNDNLNHEIKISQREKDVEGFKEELERKECSLQDDIEKVKNEIGNRCRKINDEIRTLEEQEASAKDSLQKTETDMNATFALNFGKKKELKAKIEDLQKLIPILQTDIGKKKEEFRNTEESQDKRIRSLNDEIASLKTKISSTESEIRLLKEDDGGFGQDLAKKEEELKLLDKIKKNFHSLYLIKEYGRKFGYDDAVNELVKSDLNYEPLIRNVKETQSPATNNETSEPNTATRNEEIKNQILEVLSASSRSMTAVEITNAVSKNHQDVPINKVSALLTQLKEDNLVVRTVMQRKAYFSVVDGYRNVVSEVTRKSSSYESPTRNTSQTWSSPSRIQIENEEIKDQILEVLKISSRSLTATEITERLSKKHPGISITKVSALLTELREDNEVSREVINRKAYFSIA